MLAWLAALRTWLAVRFARLVRGRFFLTTNQTNQTKVLPYETFAHHTTIADSGIQFVAKVALFFIAQRYKFEAIRNKDYSVVKTSKAANF